jgi:uncharacterized protein YjbI with pentapeptide repeats
MPRQSPAKPRPATELLAGKKVAFVGKFGYHDMWRSLMTHWCAYRGGSEVESMSAPDYLVAGDGRGGKPPGDVAKVQKKYPAVQTLTVEQYLRMVRPTAEELRAGIAAGEIKEGEGWERLTQTYRLSGSALDMENADLRKLNLYGAHLESINLNGADFRGGKLEYAHLPNLCRAKFDEADAASMYLHNLEECSFRGARLNKAWFCFGAGKTIERCDFREAVLAEARLQHGAFMECDFTAADLSDALLEQSSFKQADFTKANLARLHACRARFERATFAKANLEAADLRNASLVNADLRQANLKGAILSEADLSGASVAGADFEGAVLTGANITGVDFSKAKNYQPPVVRTAGPRLQALAAAAAGSRNFQTSAEVDLGRGEFARLRLNTYYAVLHARSEYHRNGGNVHDQIPAPTVEQALLNLADRWPNGKLRLDTITAKGSKTLRGQKLQDAATEAWAEVFGITVDIADLKAKEEAQRAEAARQRERLIADIRKKGVEVWHAIPYQERERIDLTAIDLAGADLSRISMWNRDLRDSTFKGARLREAELWNANLQNADFSDCDLSNAKLQASSLQGARFLNADLTGVGLENAKLQGADFTGATVTDVRLDKAQFDEATQFPAGFTPPDSMLWKGEGVRPGTRLVPAPKAGSLSFEDFSKKLSSKVDVARMLKATSMLKAEKFQLFAEVGEESIVGIVKSQSSDERIYSCRLASTGAFSCCTQNLRPCGGLQGSLCKHLLVLIIGLAKAGQIDSATVDHWIDLSRANRPAIDEDVMSATFLRYKGAEAGEIDWRPTETIPEDFYAM